MIIVFGIIIIIWAISKIIKPSDKKNTGETNEIKEAVPAVGLEAVSNIEFESSGAEDENEEELIAVITAAVAAILQKSVSGFRVVSFKKRSNWK